MQLNNKRVSAALATATCALLGPSQQASAGALDDWKFETAILYYGEADRVSLAEGVINGTKTFSDDSVFNGKLVIDTLTGASANGAVAQPYVQTFTRPSGKGQYEVGANNTPLDDTFHDTRVQASANWMQPFNTDWRYNVGANVSKEFDYMSLGVNGSLERDLFQRNTTLSGGLSFQYDIVDPVGGRPDGLTSMAIRDNSGSDYEDDFDGSRAGGSDTKQTADVLFGVTQVISRRMLVQLNYGFSHVSGYMTDPYKVLSVVDDTGMTQDIVYEQRPDSRTKHSVFLQTKYALDNGVADVSYRFATDDWNIDSHTIDSRLRIDLGSDNYIQPHIRYYTQSAADFYRPFLEQSAPLPAFASADYRLGEMTAYTLGLKYGQKMDNGQEWAVRLEYYQQNPTNPGYEAPGLLQDQDLYPSIKAIIAQFNYRF